MSQSTFRQQYRLLLWKNCILKLRRPLVSLVEILIPLAVIMILMLIRNIQSKSDVDRCYIREKSMDSLGPSLFVRDFLCTFNSTCYNKTQINWNDTNQMDFQTFLGNISSVFQSFPTSNLTLDVIIKWMYENPLEVEKLNNSLLYLSKVLSTPLRGLQLILSGNSSEVMDGVDILAAFVCGSSLNDINMLVPFFLNSNDTVSERNVQSCETKFHNKLIATDIGSKIYQYIAPILFGKIYYTPISKFTEELVTQANISFVILDNLRLASIEWRLHFKDWIEIQLENNTKVENLRSLTKLCIEFNLPDIVSYCKFINNLLNTTVAKSTIDILSLSFSMIENVLNCVELNKFVAVENSTYIDNFKESELINVFAGLIFDPSFRYLIRENATILNYTIRMPTNRIDSTRNFKVLDRFWTPAPRRNTFGDMKYYTSGFLMLQEAIDRAFIQIVRKNDVINIGSSMQIMPSPCFVDDKFIQFASRLMPFFLLIAWSPTFSILVKNIVYEKEKRLKEFMLVMGLSNPIHWLAWFTISVLTTLIPSILTAIILRYRLILEFSSPGVIFVLLFSYVVSFICQAFMLSVFFSKANVAAVVSLLAYFIFYIPFLILINNQDDVTYSIYFLSGIFSQVSFCNAINFIAYWEQAKEGAQFSNLFQSTVLNLNFGVGHCIIMLWIDAVVYLLITWYVEAVFPGEYGTPKSWYFFVTKHYWNPSTIYPLNAISLYENGRSLKDENNSCPDFEKVPENLEIGISIQNLTKRFSKASAPSVDNLNLDFYKSHITAFLGHNGAGKTTTISMLTGIFPPTYGTAYILHLDIRKDIDNIRKVMGLCPQHNILFDNLTVEDHMYFYGFLKGMTLLDVKATIPHIAEDVGLLKKLKTQSKYLSGGMKRKLSVAMAFIGDSKIIFLDEPTAGVDPFARRGIWDLLMKYRSPEKTIVLTTHHMDEADYLSDRIAIISQGKLRCSGSSVFLKRQFGEGYNLILMKTDDAQLEDFNENDHSISGKNIFLFIRKHIHNAKFIEETRTQWNFILPLDGLKNNCFSIFFQSLDNSLDVFKISTYGLSDTSLENVFLKVADDPSKCEKSVCDHELPTESLNANCNLSKTTSSVSLRNRLNSSEMQINDQFLIEGNVDYDLLSGIRLLGQQILGLEIKRFHYTKRNVKGLFAELLLPVIMIIIIIGAIKLLNPFANEPPMIIHPWLMMPKARIVNLNTFYRKENITNFQVDKLTEIFRTDLGESGIRCMNSSINILQNLKCYGTSGNKWSGIPKGPIQLNSPSCDCNKTGYQICSNPLSGGPLSSSRLMSSSDILNNLTGYNISDHLIKNFETYAKIQYGGYQILLPSYFGLSCKFIGNSSFWDHVGGSIMKLDSINSYPKELGFLKYLRLFFNLSGTRTNFTRIWVNNKGYVSMPAYANIFDNLLLRSYLNSSVNSKNYGIIVSSYPFKFTQTDLIERITSQTFMEVSLSNFVILALSLIPASFVIFLIEERVSGSKRQQFVSGLNPYVYWISVFFWDIVKYLISAILIILIFLAFNYQSYIGSKNIGAFVTILFIYGFAIIPHMYPFSFIISTSSTAFVVLAGYNMFVGSVTTITTFFLDQLEKDDLTLVPINNVLKKLFMIFPQYGLGRGMMDLSLQYLKYNITNGKMDYDPFGWESCGKKLASFGILFVFWSSVVLIIESGIVNRVICGKISNIRFNNKLIELDEDINVALERTRVKNDSYSDDVLRVIDLTKVYNATLKCSYNCCNKKISILTDVEKRKIAVDNICFGVKAGECFGLLGVNGAGKTTTFKMLTGEESITNGDALINGKSTIHDMVAAHKDMGFCPQFDALHPLLTCEEELYFYCRIRGIKSSMIKSTVESSLQNLSINPHATKTTHTLSGGNKRKLSTAISLIGSPKVIFMDEPTSGMDAGARRFLWNTIKELTNQRRAVILTSHNMEECEVLCHRLAIMVNGQFQCLGSVQQLKSAFGNDYYVTLRMRSNRDDTIDRKKIKDSIDAEFKCGVFLKDENFATIKYQMNSSLHKLCFIFDFFEALKLTDIIVDYSVSQMSLDDVFINFAKKDDVSKIHNTTDLLNIPEIDKIGFISDGIVDIENTELLA